jgi:hypothetical protein
MTSIPNNQFQSPEQLNSLVGVSASRILRLADQSVELVTSCQDPNNPSLVFIEFSLSGIVSYMAVIKILEVDGDASFGSNGVVARIVTNDIRTTSLPVSTVNGIINGKILADFGSAIPNFLAAQKITFRLEMVPQVSVIPGTTIPTSLISKELAWEKGVLPTPYTLSYENGVLKVYFQYLGEGNCACQIQCVTPSGVSSDINFCPDDIQAVSITKELNGDPFTFNVLLRDGIGNTSTLDITTLINVIPISPIVSIEEVSSRRFRAQISINRLNFRGISVSDADYQIIKYTDTPENYVVWKDWSIRGWDTFMDYNIKEGHTYGYAVRYKGKYGDISEFSPWAVVEAVNIDYSAPPAEPVPYGFGEWVERFIHTGQETNAFSAYTQTDFTGVLSLSSNQLGVSGKVWPERFKAVHAALIPKGRYRGHIIVWDTCLLIGSDPTICPGELIAFQPYSIINPSPASGEVRFRNFLVPLGPSRDPAPGPDPVPGATGRLWANLFCVGQTWTHNGDLLMAGGAFVTDNFVQYGVDKTYIWNPAGTSTYFFGSESGATYYGTLTGGHYNDGAGCWVEGPELEVYRYYPTTTLSHRLNRVGTGDPVVYVFGGSTPGWDGVYGTADAIYGKGYSGRNSYEALQVTGKPVGRECGYSKDVNPVGGSAVFNGPGYLGAENYFEDSFHIYPRMYVLSSGGVFMAGNAAKSATLKNHDTAPGEWTYTEGHDYRPKRLNAFSDYNQAAFYASAFGKKDYVLKIGGGTLFINSLTPENNITGWDLSNVQAITAGITGSDWQNMPHLNRPRFVAQSVILADGSIFVFGGGRTILRYASNNELIPYPFRRPDAGTEFAATPVIDPLSPWELLHGLHGHHDQKGNPVTIAQTYAESIPQTLAESVSVGPAELTDSEKQGVYQDFSDGQIILRYCFHTVPETIFPDRNESVPPQTWSPAQSLFQYHSTALLLPDGRVFAGGGGGLVSANKGAYDPKTDYEIYAPHYLRPITTYSGLVYKKPQSVVIADATINSNPEHNAYDLNYNSQYTITCSNTILPDHIGRVVLVSPGAATHQADMAQRFFELPIVSRTGELTVRFSTPSDDRAWQKGFHMLFALSNNNAPAEAIWVKF